MYTVWHHSSQNYYAHQSSHTYCSCHETEQEAWYVALLIASKWWEEDDNVALVLDKEKKKTDQVIKVRRGRHHVLA